MFNESLDDKRGLVIKRSAMLIEVEIWVVDGYAD